MHAPPHFYVDSTCLYCDAPGARAGEACPRRAAREAEYRSLGFYEPEGALRAAVFTLGWPDPGAVRLERSEDPNGGNARVRFRVVSGDRNLAEASEIGVERAARVVRERLEPHLHAKRRLCDDTRARR